jgi:hypothetical protein
MLATPGQVSTFWVWGIAIVILGLVLAYGIAKSGRLRRTEREKLDRNTVATQQREDPRKSTKLHASTPPHMDYGVQMAHSNQGIVKTGRGEEQPVDKDRAQTAQHTDQSKSASPEETRDPIYNSQRQKPAKPTK